MRKNTLLIAAAVAALTAGSSLAFAQGAPGASQGEKANPASKSAPAEKMAPSSAAKPGGAEHAQRGEQKNEHSTVGQGQMNERNKAGQANERSKAGEANKMGQANERNKTKSETTGQAPNQANQPSSQSNQKQDKLKSNAEQNKLKANEKAGQERNERNRATTGQAPENRGTTGQSTTESRSSTSGSVTLSTEQRTKIHSIIVSERSAPRVAHVDFDVRVGTVVPRGKVKLVSLPSTIVEIEPAWRGYEYFLIGDEIVVVEPGTLRIVAVIPA